MATNQRKKRAGEAPQVVTQIAAGGAALGDTQSTPPAVTKRRYKPRARRCACGCGATFTPAPQQPRQRFATDTCRQRGHRAKAPTRPRRQNGVERLTCDHCGTWYVGTVGKGRKYCTTTCKRLAAKTRREAVAEALAAVLAMPLEEAAERVELVGMVAARRAVAALAG